MNYLMLIAIIGLAIIVAYKVVQAKKTPSTDQKPDPVDPDAHGNTTPPE